MDLPLNAMTFVVRAVIGDAGLISGVVERVQSGEKLRFYAVEEIATQIARMVHAEQDQDLSHLKEPRP